VRIARSASSREGRGSDGFGWALQKLGVLITSDIVDLRVTIDPGITPQPAHRINPANIGELEIVQSEFVLFAARLPAPVLAPDFAMYPIP
jgi:hypothetical protein